jgi:hypothetical protein
MRASIYIALAFALAIWIGTMCGHYANRHVKSEIGRGGPLNPIEAEVMR